MVTPTTLERRRSSCFHRFVSMPFSASKTHFAIYREPVIAEPQLIRLLVMEASALHQMPPLAVRVPEACRLTGIGRSKLYELIKDGEVRAIKIGSITLIPISSLETLLEL